MSFFPMPTSARRGDYAIFSDETSISKSRFMAIGGVLCRPDAANLIAEQVKDLKKPLPDSFQWKHVNNRKVGLYKCLIDLAIDHIDQKRLDFGCIVLDRRDIDHTKFNEGDGERGFSKFMYQMCMGFARTYTNQCTFKFYHGYRETSEPLETLKEALNNACFSKFFELGSWPCRFVEAKYADVSGNELLQIADVFLGAIGHRWNEREKQRPDSAKAQLAAYLERECPLQSLAKASPYACRHHFWIWPFRLQTQGSGA